MEFILDKSHYALSNLHQTQTRTPYPFQEKAFEALDKVKENNPDGFSTMLVLPTGAGKTYTAAHWILKNYINQGIKVLWVAHRGELLRQAAEAFYQDTTVETLPDRNEYISYVVSSEFGRCCNIRGNNPDVLIASRQSLCSYSNMDYALAWAKGRELKKDRKLLIVLDEAHHAAASSYRTIINSMKKFIPHIDILGLTATPFRTAQSEQGSLKKIFNTGTGIAYKIDMSTLIEAGILATPKHIEVSTNIDMTQIFDDEQLRKISRNDLTTLDEKSLDKLNKNINRNKLIVDTYLTNKEKFGQTLVFAVDVLNAIALDAIFKSVGVRSDFVVSAITKGATRISLTDHNTEVIREFKNKKLDVLINVNIITEGTDIPNIQTVFLARPTTSKILMTQMVGRALRGEAAGGTKEAQIVYFVDEWKGLVEFVSPKELLDGSDAVSKSSNDKKSELKHYVQVADVARYAVGVYEASSVSAIQFNNIIPYGIIKCNYMTVDEYGDETEVSKDVIVFDEAVEIYNKILSEIPNLFANNSEMYTEREIRTSCLNMFFKYCEDGTGSYIGVSSEMILDIVLSFLESRELPKIRKIEGRVSLMDIVKKNYIEGMSDEQIEEAIKIVWEHNSNVRSWYEKDFYNGMMHVYFNRMKPIVLNKANFILPPKEKMDMGELKKYYPSYYNELREYLILNMKKDEEGYYYSAIQVDGEPPIRSKHLRMFEMDHIIPMSENGLTVKENLQMITWWQNREKSNKVIK